MTYQNRSNYRRLLGQGWSSKATLLSVSHRADLDALARLTDRMMSDKAGLERVMLKAYRDRRDELVSQGKRVPNWLEARC